MWTFPSLNSSLVENHRIQLAVPKLVAIAVRMVITTCTTVFHVSLFILAILKFLTSHLSKECPLQGNSVDSFAVIRTCGVRSTGAAALRWAAAGLLLTRQLAVQLRAQLGALLHG